jgi:hypothetical protein
MQHHVMHLPVKRDRGEGYRIRESVYLDQK